jgi:hypothetical protein
MNAASRYCTPAADSCWQRARVYGQPGRQLTHFGPKVGLTTLLALYANLYSASFSVQQSYQAL